MNCIASSLASFIVGGVVVGGIVLFLLVMFTVAALKARQQRKEKRVALIDQCIDAAVEMVLDDRVEEYVSDDVDGDDANAPTVTYGVPADRLEAVVRLLEEAGEIE